MTRAILFDLDNTLYAYDPCNEAALTSAYELLAASIDVTYARFRQLHDNARRQLAERLVNQASSHNRLLFFKSIVESLGDQQQPELVLQLYRRYWSAFYASMQLNPAAHEVLGNLKEKYQLVMISNHTTEPQLEKIHRLDIARYFDVIMTSEEAGCEKPDPRIFAQTLKRLGLAAAEVVMVGDHPIGDIAGTKAAGIQTIQTVQYTQDPPHPAADHVISQLEELLIHLTT